MKEKKMRTKYVFKVNPRMKPTHLPFKKSGTLSTMTKSYRCNAFKIQGKLQGHSITIS